MRPKRSRPTAAGEHVLFFAQLGADRPDSELVSEDVPGAYYYGAVPPASDPGGRVLYMRIPAEFEVVGLGLRGANGKRMCLFVQGNLSG